MVPESQFDLSQLFDNGISLKLHSNSPTRMMFSKKPVNPYDKLFQQDPLQALGETKFQKPRTIPEDVVGTPIQEFFRGANVFMTGGTGFIGKILTEKLVRSVPHLGQIYLLIRAKRSKSAQERFEQLLEDPVFRRMRDEVPDYASKLTVVEGDISAPGLGLSAADERTLLDHVTVVFHSAADVKFMEPLRVAISSNVLGSRSMLTLARGMNKLKSYVHVSTAYSQCVRRVVPETVPKMSVHYKEVMKLVDSHTDEEIENDLPRTLHEWPNTYTFTKAMCEEMLQEEGEGLPICIVRPAAVMGTYHEPVRGWTDNMNGPTGILTAIVLGILHCINIDHEQCLDIVPVDYTANCIIASAWDSNKKAKDNLPVYNYVSTPSHGVPWKTYDKYGRIIKDLFSIQQSIWYYSFTMIKSATLHTIAHFLLHTIPGHVLDKIAVWNGQKPRLSRLYGIVSTFKKPEFQRFMSTIWEFESENVQRMLSAMTPEDKVLFNFDIRDVDSQEYILVFKLGVRYYYFKEKMETLTQAQKKNTVFRWLHHAGKCLFGLALLKMMVMVAHVLPI